MREIKNTAEVEWTAHAKAKLILYGISLQKVKQVLRAPMRVEEGVAPETTAMMLPYGSPTKDGRLPYRGEIWVMVRKLKTLNSKLKIISVWRYPGKSSERGPVPIPDEIRQEIA